MGLRIEQYLQFQNFGQQQYGKKQIKGDNS